VNATVVGAGAWGTALAKLLHEGGQQITLWGHEPQYLQDLARTGFNERYLPGIPLPRDWKVETDLKRSVKGSECVIVAVPSKAFREVTRNLAGYPGILVSVTKGIEYETGLTMCGVLRSHTPDARTVALSGPTFALEVARGIPTAIVAASDDEAAAQTIQQLFHRPTLRIYTSADWLGVELGGALKNVVAIAAGVGDGLGFGDNSKAALLTRGIVEMRRLGVACGAQGETFSGLSGLGDLAVTCFSKLSRNRGLGERLGRGEKLETILATSVAIAEGYPTTRSAFHIAKKLNVVTPIIDEVYALLYQGKNVAKALQDLMGRESKAEED
jgi:glycerol-3-phosphate dehydrogenase (NAD(P)+)